MRWPLSIQILARILLIALLTICAVTFANIQNAISSTRQKEEQKLERITKLMQSTKFPLTDLILENMKSLSGAEFALIDHDQNVYSSTNNAPASVLSGDMLQDKIVSSQDKTYYHETVPHTLSNSGTPLRGNLHVFVERQSDREVWWQAAKSPLTIALIVLPLALLIGSALSNQVTRPLANLKKQVSQIAGGNIQQVPVNRVNDEIRDLAISTNEMASQLQEQKKELRKNERLKTMIQVGNGIAHHLRNSSTGCRMAVELLSTEDNEVSNSDNYEVAIRQLGLMDNYIKKFLLLSKSSSNITQEIESIDLCEVLDNVFFLLQPSAKHFDVRFEINKTSDGSLVRIDADEAEQLMMNLLTNALAAANSSGNQKGQTAEVSADLRVHDSEFRFTVSDNGPGPPPSIADDIFQPFVTGSKEGTGLGLSLVKQIAERMGGKIQWERRLDKSVFQFQSKI